MPHRQKEQTSRNTPLFQTERQRKIVALVNLHGAIEVQDLADDLQVTTETIRRDLTELQSRRLLKRVHGGAISWKSFEPLLSKRTVENDDDKRRIAARAVEELPHEGSILIDAGSTLVRFAEAIPSGRSLHVVTNSLTSAQSLAESKAASVTILGGDLHGETLSVVDAQAVEQVRKLSVDALFISADGTSMHGLSTPYSYEASLKEAMIRSAMRVVALIDPSKFGNDQMMRFGRWSQIDTLITGTATDPATLEEIASHGVTVAAV